MRVTFTGKQHEAGDIWSFAFTPAKPFVWEAGQSVRLEIVGPYGPVEHRFSISSPPGSNVITVTTRITDSDYKESLTALTPGAPAAVYGLEGAFTWRESPHPHLFIAGGIGVTPFHAMLAERALHNLPPHATLLYANRDAQVAFKPFFDSLHAQPGFAVHYHIGKRLVPADVLPHIGEGLIYISGPQQMAGTLRAGLLAGGVPEGKMICDLFTGRLPYDG